MSSVSGVGSSSLYQYLQAIQSSQANSSGAAQSANGTTSTSSTEQAAGAQGTSRGHGRRHAGTTDAGGSTGGAGGTGSAAASARFQQIQTAVASALQSAQANPAAKPNKVVTDAIASIFKNSQNSSSAPTTDTEIGSDEDNSSGSVTADSAEQSDFSQTLQEYGIDPDQFQQDFQSAVQQAQGGQVDSSTAFRSFPPGVMVDTTA